MAALAAEADAQSRPVGGGARMSFPGHSNHFSWEGRHGFHRGFGGVWVVEREVPVVIEREVVREKPAEPVAVAAPASPRKPYVIGSTYASLPPQGCMKLIDDGVSYYYCGGDWYRQLGGRGGRFKAVAKP